MQVTCAESGTTGLQRVTDAFGNDPEATYSRSWVAAATAADARQRRLEAFADSVIVTTTSRVERHRVDREIGLESVEFVVEGGLISELTSEFHRLLRQGPADSGRQLNSIKHPAIRLLTLRAAEQGANAILNTALVYEGHEGTRARFVLRGTLVALVPHPPCPSAP